MKPLNHYKRLLFHQPHTREVTGSSPVASTKKKVSDDAGDLIGLHHVFFSTSAYISTFELNIVQTLLLFHLCLMAASQNSQNRFYCKNL
jgi:hypothetical protein